MFIKMAGYTYILLCEGGFYYTGSTKHLEWRIAEHFAGLGANFTRKHPPEELVYCEEFDRIDHAFNREKQIQGWNRAKKQALIKGEFGKLPNLSKCANDSNSKYLRAASNNKDN